jgi:protein TonB
MDKKIAIELIKLEVLGFLSEHDKTALQARKENDEDFPWKELAEYQNLVALLAALKRLELPSRNLKDNMVKKLNAILYGEGAMVELVEGEQKKGEAGEKPPDKIDWGMLSVLDTLPSDESEYKEEVKPKPPAPKKEPVHKPEFTRAPEQPAAHKAPEVYPEIRPEKLTAPRRRISKYILASVILLVIPAVILSYIFIIDKKGVSEKEAGIQKQKDNVLETVSSEPAEEHFEEVKVDEVVSIPVKEVKELPEAETTQKQVQSQTKTQSTDKTGQTVIPKPPPRLPEPIEAPLEEMKDVAEVKDEKAEDETDVPPPKKNEEAEEEPTYFVAVEEMPEPIGGLKEIQKKIIYPEIARRVGIEGKVFVRAFIDETGTVTSAEVVKGIGGGCDEAALDAILKTKFTPGKQRGRAIKVQVTIPVVFKL